MNIIYVASWAISVYVAYQRTWKPFNPILGETYEMANHQGITFISEQVVTLPNTSEEIIGNIYYMTSAITFV